MSNWNKIFKPIVVLCVICIVVTSAWAADTPSYRSQ